MKTLALPTPFPTKAVAQQQDQHFQKSYLVHLFNGMSSSYERMNYLTSFGFSRLWRSQMLASLPASDQPVQVVDLMTGMGEMWGPILRKWKNADLTALDFSDGMLHCAALKNHKKYEDKVHLHQTDVLQNPLPPATYDVVTCAFGLKTLSKRQMSQLARETHRLLKPNGRFTFIEISEPGVPWLKVPYLWYIRYLIPVIGFLFARKYGHYKELGYYTQAFGNAQEAAAIFKEAGLAVTPIKLFHGCATGFYGTKTT
ncbi:class I SAM-dependent methyltransferase [Rufibacter glacialis]|uniref:Class I SAM-dependent methyltransferase n=1 Tax=Rufibacter glacialis TaxID=1259555 RepID=A0A5M8QE90_9BACT|nr:class I SAM-dependent methyltransferase [Rufibacter glacialis]KAA6433240.1 methyltransferase domain-containing protein [Rufibacter glacialis]GGK76206.1 demethylmenaquinone methyltransferase [Rufibacter glacialis]